MIQIIIIELQLGILERGLGDILIPLYGKYDTPHELFLDWDGVPEKFVIKSNHGCGTIKLVYDKDNIDKDVLNRELTQWLKQRYGLETNEKHYLKIKPCLIVEALMEDPSVKDFSRSLIDYKIWCFNGKPYTCFVAFDRDIYSEHHYFSCYDLNWNHIPEVMTHPVPNINLDKPKNFEKIF